MCEKKDNNTGRYRLAAKHNCAICGAEVGLLSEQKLADGNYICRKVCSKKCFKVFDRVAATLTDVTDHIEQIGFGTKVWNQIFVPLQKTKVKEEKLRQVTGLSDLIVYVSPSTGLIAFVENRYKFMFFGKTPTPAYTAWPIWYPTPTRKKRRPTAKGRKRSSTLCASVSRIPRA